MPAAMVQALISCNILSRVRKKLIILSTHSVVLMITEKSHVITLLVVSFSLFGKKDLQVKHYVIHYVIRQFLQKQQA